MLPSLAHAPEIRNEFRLILPAGVLEKNIEKPDNRGDGGSEFLPQEGGQRMLEPPATHDRSPARVRSASIFCISLGNSTGFVS